ncbi:MAG: TIGR03067 domain-containing protein [Usitatibacteraceae bacterium]
MISKKYFLTNFALAALTLLTACSSPEFREREPVVDRNLNGTWLIKKAELGGKNFPMPPTFELQISGTQYRSGNVATGTLSDRGKIVLFGDEFAGQAARMDVVGEDGPNKGKRFPAIYRFSAGANNRELEICYDLSEKERPTEFVSREGTMVLRVTYGKK